MVVTIDVTDEDLEELKEVYESIKRARIRTKYAEVKAKHGKTERALEKILQALCVENGASPGMKPRQGIKP